MRTITSFAKGLKVLECVSTVADGVKVSEISRALDMPSSNLTLFLNTLVASGYVLKDQLTGRYVLSQKILQLSENINRNFYKDIILLANDEMEHLAKKYNENVLLSVLNQTHLKVIHEIHSTQNIQIMNNEEDIFIPHVTALGKAILSTYTDKELDKYFSFIDFPIYTAKTITGEDELRAELQEVKEKRYAINRGEYDDAIYAVAAPIKINNNLTVAICVQYPGFRHSENRLISYGEELQATASRIRKSIKKVTHNK